MRSYHHRDQRPNDFDLATLEQVAGWLHVSIATVRRWIREGRLPATKIGRRVLIRVEDVEELVRLNPRRQ